MRWRSPRCLSPGRWWRSSARAGPLDAFSTAGCRAPDAAILSGWSNRALGSGAGHRLRQVIRQLAPCCELPVISRLSEDGALLGPAGTLLSAATMSAGRSGGRGRGGERRLRRPRAADAGTAPRPFELHTREYQGRRLADAARRTCRQDPRQWSSCRIFPRRPLHKPAIRSGGSARGSRRWPSWWGAGARPAARRRHRGSPASGRRTWPSHWPMPATRSSPGPLPRFRLSCRQRRIPRRSMG